MRIALIGAGNTGKTTLMNALSEELNIPINSLSTKSFFEEYNVKSQDEIIKLSANHPAEGIKFQEHIIKIRNLHFNHGDNWITDRTPLDSLTYGMLQTSFYDTDEHIELMFQWVEQSRKNYDLVIMLQPQKHIKQENNGLRGVNFLYHQMVASEMKRLAKLTNFKYKLMPRNCKTVKQRIDYVKKLINEFK